MDTATTMLGNAPAPSPAPAATPTPAATPSEAANDWTWDKYAKDEDLGWVQTKGYKDPADLVKAARNSEKLIGLDKVPLPKDDADTEGWNRVYDRLGRPKEPKDYKIDLPKDGVNQPLVDRMLKTLHGAGVSQRQAQAIVKDYMAFGSESEIAAQQQRQSQDTQQLEALKGEWGAAWDTQIEHGRRAAREFGVDGAMLEKIEAGIGTAETLKLFNRIGKGLTEAPRITGEDGGNAGALTPAQAKYEITQKTLDPNWMKAYMDGSHPNHKACVEEMQRLQKFAAPA